MNSLCMCWDMRFSAFCFDCRSGHEFTSVCVHVSACALGHVRSSALPHLYKVRWPSSDWQWCKHGPGVDTHTFTLFAHCDVFHILCKHTCHQPEHGGLKPATPSPSSLTLAAPSAARSGFKNFYCLRHLTWKFQHWKKLQPMETWRTNYTSLPVSKPALFIESLN